MSDQPETADNPDVMTKAYVDNQWHPNAEAAAQMQAQNYPALNYPLSTGMSEADRRKLYLQQCVILLKQALEIRKDQGVMAEIRTLLRSEQDDLMVLLDDLG